jgi:alpha-1,3-rhamnosyl/mannosyltransferase
MRIGIDARTFFQRTGIGRTTRHLLSGLAASDRANEYVVFISNHHRAEDFPYVTRNTRVVVSGADWMSGPGELERMAAEAIEHRLDLMYFLFQLPSEFPVPFAIKIYDIIPLRFPQWHLPPVVDMFRRQLPASCREAAAIVTPSYATARDLRAVLAVDEGKISVVPEAVDIGAHDFAPERPGQTESPYALFVGTLEPRKNVRFLIDLWRRHSEALGGLRLVIAGKEGWDAEACKLARAGTPGVEYAGYVPDEALAMLYAGARCLVYPSSYEGFGLPVMEAMAAGCPVITTPFGSLGEVAGDAAIVIDSHQEDRWVEALNRVSSDETLRRALSAAGLNRASEFTVRRHVSETLQVLSRVLVEVCA